MRNRVLLGLASLIVIALLTSCGKAPQGKIDAVNAAIDSAKTNQADIYVPDEFTRVQDSMNVVMTMIEAQKSKLLRSYSVAEGKLDQALALAKQVQVDAVARKEEVKNEVESLLSEIKTEIDDNTALMKRAPRGKEGAQVLEQMKTEMATVGSSVTDAQNLYNSGAYMDAYNKIKAAKTTADEINGELKDAIRKVGGRI
jgi:hypothetical protein